MLTIRQKQVLKKVLAGTPLTGLRDYPFDWRWFMEVEGEVGLDAVDMATMHGLVGSGAGRIKELPKTGRVEHARFFPNRERAESLLHEPKPPRVDSAQLNWIPEDHPARARVKTGGE